MKPHFAIGVLFLAVAVASIAHPPSPAAAQAAGYQVTVLDVLPGMTNSSAYDINDHGHVVGVSSAAGVQRAVLWRDGAVHNLGTLGGSSSAAEAINNNGQVAGWSNLAPSSTAKHATLFAVDAAGAVTAPTALGTLPGHTESIAYDINDAGLVVGRSGVGCCVGVRWDGGVMELLPLGGSSGNWEAHAVNAPGQIVGWVSLKAARWDPTLTLLPASGVAYGINDAGKIVGEARAAPTASHPTAFLFDPVNPGLGALDLGKLDPHVASRALDINTAGQIVGWSNGVGGMRAIRWTPSSPNGTTGTLTDLNTLIPAGSGWILRQARAINDAGQIVGEGEFNGRLRGFLLTPASTPPVLTAPAEQRADEGAAASLSLGSFSDGATDGPWTVDVDWGDGSAHTTFSTATSGALAARSHTYADDGRYTVTVKVTAADASAADTSFAVVVANVAPRATFQAPPSVTEGGQIVLALVEPSDPSPTDTSAGFQYAFDCGDGTGYGAFGTASGRTCAATGAGTRTVKGTVRDKNGGVSEYTAPVVITPANRPPVANAGPDQTVDEGATVQLDGSASSDPDMDPLTYSWAVGTCSWSAMLSSSSAAKPTVVAPDNGSCTVRLTVSDGKGGTHTDEVLVTVRNVNPTAAITGAPATSPEGTAVSLGSTTSDVGSADTAAGFTRAWSVTKNGSPFGSGGSGTTFDFTPDDNGTYVVSLTVTDKDGGRGTDSTTMAVTNVAPTVTGITITGAPAGSLQALAGTPVAFTGTATDPSSADTAAGFTWRWAVNDGPFATTAPVFPRCGSFTVRATATDKDGGTSAPFTSMAVTVYEAHFESPLKEGEYNVVNSGRVLPVKIAIGCGGTPLTGLSPAIQLLAGDVSPAAEVGAEEVPTTSSSAADTTGVMRAADGGYMYNLEIPGDARPGELYTVRVRPFGNTNPNGAMYIVLRIK